MSTGLHVLLLALAAASATRIITRSMIKSPGAGSGGGFQRVPLLRPGEEPPVASARVLGQHTEARQERIGPPLEDVAQDTADDHLLPTRVVRHPVEPYRKEVKPRPDDNRQPPGLDISRRLMTSGFPLLEVSQKLEDDEDTSPLEEVQLRYFEPEQTTTESPTTVPTEIQLESNATQIQSNHTTGNRTRLYPVARLWEERQETDIWSLLHAAYLCCFSGLHCFSDKLYPMFRSYLGLSTGTRPINYPLLLPRTSNDEDIEREDEESRGLLKGRLIKELLVGLLLAHASLLPWLGGVGLASGKALFTGLLSLGAAGAVAAINSQNNYFM